MQWVRRKAAADEAMIVNFYQTNILLLWHGSRVGYGEDHLGARSPLTYLASLCIKYLVTVIIPIPISIC
jgi:hypothetical protein